MPQTLLDSRYARKEPLGRGGMAEVYLAHDEVLDRDVALKVLRDKYAENEEFVERFRREARNAASLNHPHIVPVYDRGRSEDGRYYIAMEYLPSGTLKERILGEGPLDPKEATELASQVAQALGHAHEHGVIHRDVKPHNVLLTETGYAKVTDFGIAKAASETTTTSSSGLILGTVGYISPEQAMGKPVDPRNDLYSLGVVLYEMLTGKLPHRGEAPASVSFKHGDEAPHSPREANPNIPEPLDALTTKLLAKDPEDRHPSAVELVDDLERIRPGLSSLAVDTKETQKVASSLLSTGEKRAKRTAKQPPATAPMEVFDRRPRRGGRLFRVLATLLFAVILFGGLAWALTQDHSAPETSGSEDAAGKEERTPSTAQVPSSAPETSGPVGTLGGEEATPSAIEISNSMPEAPGSKGTSSGEERIPLTTPQVSGSAPETSGSEGASSGKEAKPSTVQVPKMYYASQAEGALTDGGLKLGNRTEAPNDTVPAGGVIEQDPVAGATVEKGTAVDIVVSTGPKQTPAAERSVPADVNAGSRRAPAAQTASTTAQAVSASSVHDETMQKKPSEKKKEKK